ncbi:glycosyltransferase family 4 protein [Sphingomonas morindae]|uniref:Glycosyltransferase family 4 protein n=1 Tax=Sphingomonas morindae TaxID=1541170 RepID=A0ABY4X633_9SPHN|nr:glycosyltransferase family 1 protein [Sphingomonas morindae]USI72368.1 glycosyltransferase family 4 protein [Sphingomonas morindae]
MSGAGAGPEIILDLSRLVSRILHKTPTGVDRVELAYANGLIAAAPERLRFAAVHPSGFYGRLPEHAATDFIRLVDHEWEDARQARSWAAHKAHLLSILWRTRPRPVPSGGGARVLLQASPHHLTKPALVRTIIAKERAKFVCLLHDIIPVTHPEYARPGGDRLHLKRIETLARQADGLIANSQATLNDVRPYLDRAGRPIPAIVAHLGHEPVPAPPPLAHDQRPYFVCLGTIEPRKNHLLLLHLWRQLAESRDPTQLPRLVVIGRRGWENEQVVDLLERCPALGSCVEERSHLRDAEVRSLIAGARALLLPSFAEGFGMPVPEALALGTPVVCSDLPALREAGGEVPEFLDPLDGPGWRDAILAYADLASPRRAAQLQRMVGWRPMAWRDHLALVLDFVHRLCA